MNLKQSTDKQTTVVVRSTQGRSLEQVVTEVLERLDWRSIVRPQASVVIKLNLCEFRAENVKNCNTSVELIEAVCRVLQSVTPNITLVEAHSYRAPAAVAFKNTGIYDLAKRLDVAVVNLSELPTHDVGNQLLGPLPTILLDADVFITLPKLKTHALTYFTGALKNQWGCVPRHDRIALHHSLDWLIVELNRILKPRLSLMDGLIGMEGRGPTSGQPRPLGIVLGSTDPVALDATAMRLVGLQPQKASHVMLACEQGQGVASQEQIVLDMDFERSWKDFEPAKLDWAVAAMNYLTRYRWFREHILGVNWIFYPTKRLVNFLRTIGIVR